MGPTGLESLSGCVVLGHESFTFPGSCWTTGLAKGLYGTTEGDGMRELPLKGLCQIEDSRGHRTGEARTMSPAQTPTKHGCL